MKKKKELPIHYVGTGKEGLGTKPLCKTNLAQYEGAKLQWGSSNVLEVINCDDCRQAYMKLRHIGIVDVDLNNKITATQGFAVGREQQIQQELDSDIEQKVLAKQAREQYNMSVASATKTEESTMAEESKVVQGPAGAAKKAAKAAAKPEAKKGKKGGNSEALKKAQEATQAKRAELYAKKVHMCVSENPKRTGTKGHKAFSCYKEGITVGQFIEKGGSMADVRWDEKHGFIELKG